MKRAIFVSPFVTTWTLFIREVIVRATLDITGEVLLLTVIKMPHQLLCIKRDWVRAMKIISLSRPYTRAIDKNQESDPTFVS